MTEGLQREMPAFGCDDPGTGTSPPFMADDLHLAEVRVWSRAVGTAVVEVRTPGGSRRPAVYTARYDRETDRWLVADAGTAQR